MRTAAVAGGAAYVGRKSGQRSAESSQREYEQEARINELESEQQAAPPPPPAAAPAAPAGTSMDDKIEQIKKLGELRDAGVLTDEEFLAEKKKLLG